MMLLENLESRSLLSGSETDNEFNEKSFLHYTGAFAITGFFVGAIGGSLLMCLRPGDPQNTIFEDALVSTIGGTVVGGGILGVAGAISGACIDIVRSEFVQKKLEDMEYVFSDCLKHYSSKEHGCEIIGGLLGASLASTYLKLSAPQRPGGLYAAAWYMVGDTLAAIWNVIRPGENVHPLIAFINEIGKPLAILGSAIGIGAGIGVKLCGEEFGFNLCGKLPKNTEL